jgi:hypothetical protein
MKPSADSLCILEAGSRTRNPMDTTSNAAGTPYQGLAYPIQLYLVIGRRHATSTGLGCRCWAACSNAIYRMYLSDVPMADGLGYHQRPRMCRLGPTLPGTRWAWIPPASTEKAPRPSCGQKHPKVSGWMYWHQLHQRYLTGMSQRRHEASRGTWTVNGTATLPSGWMYWHDQRHDTGPAP